MNRPASGNERTPAPPGDGASPALAPLVAASDGRVADPRGVRVSVVMATAPAPPPLVVEPPDIPIAPAHRSSAPGIVGSPVWASLTVRPGAGDRRYVIVNGEPVEAELQELDGEHAILVRGGPAGSRDRLLILPAAAAVESPGSVRLEVVIDGWRFEVEVEPATRAALRDRSRRDHAEADQSGPAEVRAIIPGVVVSVSVADGDVVTAGDQVLVVEAMKMQNELRAPRDGTVERVAVGAGTTIEVGDLLLVIR
jgi:glutaconyl-CoA/methylmalonyl-CoA decarboxylase subunit gamma